MRLSELLIYQDIVIQCHDNPDADTIASAYGLYLYYKSHSIDVRIIYSGKEKIQKTNLQLLISKLNIPLAYVKMLDWSPELLITVDCQYGEGNVTTLPARKIAVIDHHQDCNQKADYKEIHDSFGSCATLVYMMLLEEKYPIYDDIKLMTALLYGLYMDTNEYSEITHPYDMDMAEDLKPDESILTMLKNCIFTFAELEIAGIALMRYTYSETMHFAIVRANPCDRNLLGFISDLVLQVAGVDTSLAFCEYDYGFRLSVRNCNPETTAREIVSCLVQDIGTGGGHKNKAGGYIIRSRYEENYADTNFTAYLLNSLKTYFTSYDVINIAAEGIKRSDMSMYERSTIVYGMCKSRDLGTIGQKLKIRTINREMDVIVTEELYLLMNMNGEVFTVDKEYFERNYMLTKDHYDCKSEYKPSVRNEFDSQTLRLTDYLHCCISVNQPKILARRLTKTTKVYLNYDDKEYLLGETGDYLVMKIEEKNEVIIIKRDQFVNNYHLI